MDATLVEGSTTDVALGYLDYIYLAVFTLEMLIKLFAIGFRGYFTTFWTQLDFFIVAVCKRILLHTEVLLNREILPFRQLGLT